jgi:hypothetical protein
MRGPLEVPESRSDLRVRQAKKSQPRVGNPSAPGIKADTQGGSIIVKTDMNEAVGKKQIQSGDAGTPDTREQSESSGGPRTPQQAGVNHHPTSDSRTQDDTSTPQWNRFLRDVE